MSSHAPNTEPRFPKRPRRASGVSRLAGTVGFLCLLLLGACPRSITDDPGYTLRLAPTTTTMFVRDSARFTATVQDRNGKLIPSALSWSIDNQAVATVDSTGVAKAVGPGSATLQVSARGMSATASITVAADNGQTLTISPTAANLFVNATQEFTATLRDRHGDVIPSTPEWSSSNTGVATVDGGGLVRAKASGSATIQARVGDVAAVATVSVSERPPAATLVGAGDIASCTSSGDEATAKLLDEIEGTVFTAGDNAYPNGSATDYSLCYHPSWGRHKARTRPVPGNHEYLTVGGGGYFGYFGAAAGDPAKGYYSYDVGRWHIIALNSNAAVSAGSPQEQWLRQDLADHPATCTLAIWHHPRFSSARHGSSAALIPLWQALYDGGADVVISAHDHTYERFAPQTPDGVLDLARGLREFVVGTGGASLYEFNAPAPNSEVRHNATRGVLKLTLYPDRYEWQFVPVKGASFTDTGSASCH